jgi:hypothetical protein
MKKHLFIISASLIALAFKIIPTGYPDLRPDYTTTNSYATQFGNQVSCYTKAILDASPISGNSAFKVGFYLSTDTIITTSDLRIGSQSISSIALFSAISCSAVGVDLATKSVPQGTYYIGTYVDYENTVAENGFNPELDNNHWTFKNANGTPKVITYPAADVGIAEYNVYSEVEKQFSPDGRLMIKSKTANDVMVEIYSIDGKLLQKEKGQEVVLNAHNSEIVILKITTNKGSASEKIVL